VENAQISVASTNLQVKQQANPQRKQKVLQKAVLPEELQSA